MKPTINAMILLVPLTFAQLHCGGGSPEPTVPSGADQQETSLDKPRERAGEPSIGAEYGGMNEAKVARAFATTFDALEHCLEDGSQGMPYLGGSIHFYLEVDTSGSVVHGHIEKSDLGDRDISRCMLDLLRAKTWPAPVGGALGKIHANRVYFPPHGVPQPTPWESEQVASTLEELAEPIAQCKGEAGGTFTATAYMGTIVRVPEDGSSTEPVEIGKMMAVDVVPPGREGTEAIDCLVKVLRSGNYPSPGERPAKVTFTL